MRLKLTVVDSIGFADQINKENSVAPIVEYIDKQYEAYLQVRASRKLLPNHHSYNGGDSNFNSMWIALRQRFVYKLV